MINNSNLGDVQVYLAYIEFAPEPLGEPESLFYKTY
jgi:hypothetical protein